MTKQQFSNEDLIRLGSWLKIISEPKRLLLLEKIIQGVQCNCELGDALEMAPNLISHHLSILREAGLIETERDQTDGRWIYYSINQEVLLELQATLSDFFDIERIQPRQLTCGPRLNEEQKMSLLRGST